MEAHDPKLDRLIKREVLGQHWQDLLRQGHGPWEGDRCLTLAFHKLTDTVEVYYEYPGRPSSLVTSMPLETFDIDKLCMSLYQADMRRHGVDGILDRVDAHNDEIKKAEEYAKAQHDGEVIERVHDAVRRDTGSHIAPLSVPRSV